MYFVQLMMVQYLVNILSKNNTQKKLFYEVFKNLCRYRYENNLLNYKNNYVKCL